MVEMIKKNKKQNLVQKQYINSDTVVTRRTFSRGKKMFF